MAGSSAASFASVFITWGLLSKNAGILSFYFEIPVLEF
jgi:hypothetical protein